MPTAEKVRDHTLDAIDLARGRAEGLVSSGAHGLSVAVSRAADEVRERSPDIELPSAEGLAQGAASHKLRTALIVALALLVLGIIVRRASANHHEPSPSSAD